MKSFIAALRSLVLPFGATSGARIVLDGVNGRIAVYNAAGVQIGILDGTTGFKFTGAQETFQVDITGNTYIREVPDVGAYLQLTAAAGFGGLIFFQPENSTVPGLIFFPAGMYADAIESLATNSQPKLTISSPYVTGAPNKAKSQIVLLGQTNTSATDNSRLEVDAGSMTLGTTKFSRPNVTYSFSKSIPTGAVTQIANADFTVVRDSYPGLYNNGLFIPDRAGTWGLTVHARWQSQAAVTGQRQIRYQINGVDTDYTSISPTTALNGTLVTNELTIVDQYASGDQIGLQAFQNSGGALTLGNRARVHFWLIED